MINELSSRIFDAALKTNQFSLAFSTLTNHSEISHRDAALRTWILAVLNAQQLNTLLESSYDENGLVAAADNILDELAAGIASQSDVPRATVPHYKILYAFRLRQNDLRGAGSALWDRLQHIKHSSDAGLRGQDVDAEVAECYLALINCLSLVTPEQAWLLYRPLAKANTEAQKRRVVTLVEIRAAWQVELDRVADLAAGRFAIGDLDWNNPNGTSSMPGSFLQGSEAMEVEPVS